MSKLLNIVVNTVIGLMFLSSGVAAAYDNGTRKIDQKELMCLAHNIYYESGGEPEAGKIAVGMVTINRTADPRWPKTICGVVKQKTVFVEPREVTSTRVVKVGWFGKTETQIEKRTVFHRRTVCQFSWVCDVTRRIKQTDQRWLDSMDIAERLLGGDYLHYKEEMGEWLWFHSSKVNPRWQNTRKDIRIGNHIFYVDKNQ